MENKEIGQKFKTLLEKGSYVIIYPEDNTEKSAQEMAVTTDSAEGIIEFQDDNGKSTWGVIIDKNREINKFIKMDSHIDGEK